MSILIIGVKTLILFLHTVFNITEFKYRYSKFTRNQLTHPTFHPSARRCLYDVWGINANVQTQSQGNAHSFHLKKHTHKEILLIYNHRYWGLTHSVFSENNKWNRIEQHTQLTLSFILHVCASGVAPSIHSRCLFFIKHNGSCQSIISPSSSSPPLSSSSGSSKDMFVLNITPSSFPPSHTVIVFLEYC